MLERFQSQKSKRLGRRFDDIHFYGGTRPTEISLNSSKIKI